MAGAFLSGYLAQQQADAQTGNQDLQRIGALSQLAGQFEKRQAEKQLMGVLSSDMPMEEKQAALMKVPGGVGVLNQLAQAQQAMRKETQGQPIGAGGLRMPDGTIVAPAARPVEPRAQSIGSGGLRLPDGTIVPPVSKPSEKWSEPYQLGGVTVQKSDTTGQIRTAVSRPPVVNVSTNVSTGGDKKYLETRGTDLAKSMGDLEKAAGSSYATIQAMDRFIKASKTSPQGSVQPVITGVQNFLSSFGYQSKDLTDIRKMEQAIGDVLQNKMSELGARGLTDRDMDVLRQALPRIATDASSREEVANIVKKGAQSTIDEYISRRDEEMRTFPDFATRVPTPNWLRQYKPPSSNSNKSVFDAADAIINGAQNGRR